MFQKTYFLIVIKSKFIKQTTELSRIKKEKEMFINFTKEMVVLGVPSLTNTFHNESSKSRIINRPTKLVYTVQLPKVETMKDIQVDIEDDEYLTLEVTLQTRQNNSI